MSGDAVWSAKEKAMEGFLAKGESHRNCAQTILLFAVYALGEDPRLAEIARYLGGGVGRSGLTCGTLTGAALALAVRDIHDDALSPDRAAQSTVELQQLIADFREKFAETLCLDLIGCDISTKEGYLQFVQQGITEQHCVRYVGWVCDRIAALL